MEYKYYIALVIICLILMACLCCLWMACCTLGLMETKFASPEPNPVIGSNTGECRTCVSIDAPHSVGLTTTDKAVLTWAFEDRVVCNIEPNLDHEVKLKMPKYQYIPKHEERLN